MTNIFGHASRKGAIGPRGRPGTSGAAGESGIADLCTWSPKTTLKNFRENEEVLCMLLKNLKSDVKIDSVSDSVIQWFSHDGGKQKLVSKYWNAKIVEFGQRHALRFERSVYATSEVSLVQPHVLDCTSYFTGIYLTFRSISQSAEEQILLSTYSAENSKKYREISTDGVGNIYVKDFRESSFGSR